ncbi:hypothetical protein NECAME_00716 [Necator americanus]|uniref:Uncharacterized protein n=1 Tax=Necator americanus TaxID=51031 RepID=W2SV59_NECAM|nr:hypothetical protein NECAME_00716 [Necator americanus]ETN73629.1 hypothetical protein NECAME_00716 [Necator americanus]
MSTASDGPSPIATADFVAYAIEILLENSEAIVLNVSPAFSTAYNGVQFTWALRLSDECVVSTCESASVPSVRQVLVLLYYKDGPCSDVTVEEAKAAIICPQTGAEVFSGFSSENSREFTKGSGWPLPLEKSKQSAFTNFVHSNIDKPLNIVVDIKFKNSLFDPLSYLPDVERACRSQRIENNCIKFVNDYYKNSLDIPNLDLLRAQDDKFSMHRLVFLFGCDRVEKECFEDQADEHNLNLVRSTFAHVYFERVLMREVQYFEDFISLLEGIGQAHIPPLRKEIERFICREVMSESSELDFTKKMLLLAERYSLDVLKMVASGVLVDQIIAHSNPPGELVNISYELKRMASEINDSLPADPSTPTEEVLVGSVVEDLQSLTRRVRRVSLSHSPSSSTSSPSSSPPGGATPTDDSALSPAPTVPGARPFDPAVTPSRFKRIELA